MINSVQLSVFFRLILGPSSKLGPSRPQARPSAGPGRTRAGARYVPPSSTARAEPDLGRVQASSGPSQPLSSPSRPGPKLATAGGNGHKVYRLATAAPDELFSKSQDSKKRGRARRSEQGLQEACQDSKKCARPARRCPKNYVIKTSNPRAPMGPQRPMGHRRVRSDLGP